MSRGDVFFARDGLQHDMLHGPEWGGDAGYGGRVVVVRVRVAGRADWRLNEWVVGCLGGCVVGWWGGWLGEMEWVGETGWVCGWVSGGHEFENVQKHKGLLGDLGDA